MTSVGAVFRPQLAPERLRAVAVAADGSGLDELWLWEDCFREGGIASAAAALAWTSRLRVGIGVMPVPLRNPALAAMEIATIDRMFPGRLLPGVGHGVQDWMRQVGGKVASPLTLLGEHLDVLRALLAGERVTTSGRYVHLADVGLDWPPAAPVRVLAAAEGPKTLHLSGARADGTVLPGGATPEAVRRARQLTDAGRAEADRADDGTDHHRLTVFVMAVPAAAGGQEEGRARAAAECARWGWSDAEDRVVVGDVAAVAEQLGAWVAAGADSVVLQPAEDEADVEAFVAFAAAVGRALAGSPA